MEPAPELLESGSGAWVGWRPPRWLVVSLTLVAVVGLAGWYADRGSRGHEAAALDSCRRALHNAVISSDLQMVSVADNLRPTLATTTGPRRTRLVEVMSNPARALLPEVTAADRQCRAVRVWPWHRALRAGRDTLTAYSSALLLKVRQMAADGRAYFRDDPALRRLRRAADLGVVGGRY